MDVFYYPGERPSLPSGSVVTIGAYDGVHLGHRKLIERVRKTAVEIGAASVVVTFDRHPASVVRPESAPRLLTNFHQKLELLASTGVDVVLVVRFDKERASEPAPDFVSEVLVGCLGARAVVVGHDFHFGRAREGDVPLLQRMGAQLGFDVTGCRLVSGGAGDEAPISSTRIRALVANGEVGQAASMLGRWYCLQGVVGHGDKRGRELGYPTANLEVSKDMQLCADGVYAGWYLRPDGTRHQTAISVGRQPTFYGSRPFSLVEAYLLDFQGDLYDELGTVELVERLRQQEKFASVEALVDQMASDVAQTRRALAASGPLAAAC
ncbi:MAG: bifunctional riboflavin kinase/FAD synthetase [Acidimicrobiales bacterium]